MHEVITQVEARGDRCYVPELLRVQAGLLQSIAQPRTDEAEARLVQSLGFSRGQGARAWELRAATDLAALLIQQGYRDRARSVLQPVFEQFTEGFDTTDLIAAERLLATL